MMSCEFVPAGFQMECNPADYTRQVTLRLKPDGNKYLYLRDILSTAESRQHRVISV